MKDKEEFKYVKQFEKVANEVVKKGYTIPSYCFISTNEKLKYAAYIYYNDKMIYAKTKKWPKRHFLVRDLVWTYYYYLQISDTNLDLDKYLDFTYDTNKYKRKDLERLMINYGTSVLFKFSIYNSLREEKDFDIWVKEYQDELSENDLFNKTTSK